MGFSSVLYKAILLSVSSVIGQLKFVRGGVAKSRFWMFCF